MKRLTTIMGIAVMMMMLASTGWGQLSGSYYIGANAGTKPGGGNPDYSTLSTAITALNASGVSGPCIFYFLDASYTEPANVAVAYTGSSATNTVTFKPYTGVTTTINFTQLADNAGPSGCWVIGSNTIASYTLVKTDYLIIDGSNTNGGTTRDLSLTNVENTPAFQYGIRIVGDNDNVTIKNINLTLTETGGSSTYGILITARNQTATNYIPDNTIIDNCNVTVTGSNAGQAIAVSPSGTITAGQAPTGIIVRNNTITARTRGVFMNQAVNYSVYGNTISVNQTNSGSLSVGIYAFSTNSITVHTCNIYNNKFIQLSSANTSSAATGSYFGIAAIVLEVAGTFNVYNNFISGFSYSASTQGVINGIRISTASSSLIANIYHNTVNIGEVSLSDSLYAIMITSGTFAGTADIRNNIMSVTDADAGSYGISRPGAGTGTYTSNYNDLYVSGTNAKVGYWLGTGAVADLATWQSSSSQDANSKSVAVTFASSTDLHLVSGSDGDFSLTGVTGLGIGTDIDGDARSGTAPYMGADETATALPVELTSFTAASHGKAIDLSWATASESNNYGFDVERRAVNQQSTMNSWTKVAFVEGHGTTSSPLNYSFTDNSATSGKYSYRLKQIDRNGKFTYSKEVEAVIALTPAEYTLSQNYPNPFNPSTTIRFAVKAAGQVSLKVYNAAGQEVRTLFNDAAEPEKVYSVLFDGSGMASGTYFYVLQTPASREVKKMLMVK